MTSVLDEQLNNLIDEIDAESIESWVEKLSEEELHAAFKKINPYGVTLPSEFQQSASFSYTNYRMEFARQLSTTTIIAYLFNQLRDWQVPDEVRPIEIDAYMRDATLADTPAEVTNAQSVARYEENRRTMADRVAAYRFLKHMFDFDPDRHAASVLTTCKGDPERRLPRTAATKRAVRNPNNVRAVPAREYEARVDDLTYTPEGEIERAALGIIPSMDSFNRLERYGDENHEELLQCTYDIYGARPDIDFSINVYAVHNSKEESEAFKVKHGNMVIAPITNVQCNKWALLGPYRQNRERVDYMNSNTELLKAMIDKREQDSRTGSDIVSKRIKVKKKQNRIEAGPDDDNFKTYIRENKPAIDQFGANRVEQKDDEVRDSSDDDEDDGKTVQVKVFNISDGGAKLKTHRIHNAVEAPGMRPEQINNCDTVKRL